MAKDLLTSQDVCTRLSISQRTLWRWVSTGYLPQPIRRNSHFVRWLAKDIDKFLDNLASTPQNPS